jgi:hypothetical protein
MLEICQVLGFTLTGNEESCSNGMVALEDNTLAVLSQQNVLVLADPDGSTLKQIPLNNGAAEVIFLLCPGARMRIILDHCCHTPSQHLPFKNRLVSRRA